MNIMSEDKPKVILTARGLNCSQGQRAIVRAIKTCIGDDYKKFFSDKTILVCTIKEYGINELLRDQVIKLGFKPENIDLCDGDNLFTSQNWDCIYISESNTFQIAEMLRRMEVWEKIKASINSGGLYIGASAGAILATSSIMFASDFDKNFVRLSELDGLDILPKSLGKTTLIPHYNKQQFLRWMKNTPREQISVYDWIGYIANCQFRVF